MPVIRLPSALYHRLEAHARGFDTPVQVIERILDVYEGKQPNSKKSSVPPEDALPKCKPDLTFHPDEETFRQKLIQGVTATVLLRYDDGLEDERTWNPSRFSEKSSLRGNIWSGFLRDWKENHIVSADFYAGDEWTGKEEQHLI